MKISNDKKKEILLKNFEIIKTNPFDNEEAMCEVVRKMFKIDIDTAVELWKYILKVFENKIKSELMYHEIGEMWKEAGELIGEVKIDDIVIGTPEIKTAFFSYVYDGASWPAASIVRNQILRSRLEIANELLDLLYNNKYKNESWYEIMDALMRYLEDKLDYDNREISQEAYDLLEYWSERITNNQEKAKIAIKLLSFVE